MFISCGNLKSEAKTYYNLHENFIRIAEEASRDQIITQTEAEKLNAMKFKIDELQKKVSAKLKDNDELKLQWNAYGRELNGEFVIEKYIEASFKLYDCEGVDLLD
ncbi:MAG: hypothetical protein GX879_04775 [Bacteroidales bacterium]|nr:hypothetical protein [Bacteroidales bacterium]